MSPDELIDVHENVTLAPTVCASDDSNSSDCVPPEMPPQSQVPFPPPFTPDERLAARMKLMEGKQQYSSKIILDISYNHMTYVKITQSPSMTFSTFVGNIGGQIGLWIGASIISCVKIFIVLGPLVYTKVAGLFR
jgi:hypothetical protein